MVKKPDNLRVVLTGVTPNVARKIARAGRTTWKRGQKSDEELTDELVAKAIQVLGSAGHLSVLEHGQIQFYIVGTTIIARDDDVWDRFGRYTSGSHQYQKVANFGFQVPATICNNDDAYAIFVDVMKQVDAIYTGMISGDDPIRQGFARNIIPRLTTVNLNKTIDLNNLTRSLGKNIMSLHEFTRKAAIMQLVLSCKFLPLFKDYFFDRVELYSGIELPRGEIERITEQDFATTGSDDYYYIEEPQVETIEQYMLDLLRPEIQKRERKHIELGATFAGISIELEGHLDVTHLTEDHDFSSLVINNRHIPYVSYTHMIRQRKADFQAYEDWYMLDAYSVRIPPPVEHREHYRRQFKQGVDIIKDGINKLLSLGIPWVDVYGLLPFGLQVNYREWIRLSDLINFMQRRVCNREEFPSHTIGQLQYMVAYNVFPHVLEQLGTFPCVERYLQKGVYECEEPPMMYERTCNVRGPYLLAEFEEMKAIAKKLSNPWVASETDMDNLRDKALESMEAEYGHKPKLIDKVREDSKRNRGF